MPVMYTAELLICFIVTSELSAGNSNITSSKELPCKPHVIAKLTIQMWLHGMYCYTKGRAEVGGW